jgi:hypothetical protein
MHHLSLQSGILTIRRVSSTASSAETRVHSKKQYTIGIRDTSCTSVFCATMRLESLRRCEERTDELGADKHHPAGDVHVIAFKKPRPTRFPLPDRPSYQHRFLFVMLCALGTFSSEPTRRRPHRVAGVFYYWASKFLRVAFLVWRLWLSMPSWRVVTFMSCFCSKWYGFWDGDKEVSAALGGE